MTRWILAIVLMALVPTPSSAENERGRMMNRAKDLTKRADENRPDDQLTLYLLERPLIIGGELQLQGRYRGDYRLDDRREDDEARLRPRAELEAFYPLSRDISLFIEGKLGYESDVYHEAGDEETEWQLQRGETWLHWADIAESGLSFQVGRQNFKDRREWWWDADLDALRVTYDIADFEIELGMAQELAPVQANEDRIHPDFEDVLFVLGRGTWYWEKKNRLELFFASRHDDSRTHRENEIVDEDREDDLDSKLWWLGARAMGRFKYRPIGVFHYWLDAAYVRGEETIIDFDTLDAAPSLSEVDEVDEFDVSGWGVDVGVTWDARRRFWPRVTLGYAWGSGDGSPGKTDRTFRQTGIQDNNGKFRGVDRFKYYGEVFRPELSNMHITTVGLGFSFFENSSVELLHHAYWQDEAAPFLRHSRLKAGPQGRHRSLGQEINLVIGLEEWMHWEVEIIGGVFRAGSAFGAFERDLAHLGLFKVDYNF